MHKRRHSVTGKRPGRNDSRHRFHDDDLGLQHRGDLRRHRITRAFRLLDDGDDLQPGVDHGRQLVVHNHQHAEPNTNAFTNAFTNAVADSVTHTVADSFTHTVADTFTDAVADTYAHTVADTFTEPESIPEPHAAH
jgi:hypothetical protein